jgi:hypothetical protein
MSIKSHKGLNFGLLHDESYIKKMIERVAEEVNIYYENILKE